MHLKEETNLLHVMVMRKDEKTMRGDERGVREK